MASLKSMRRGEGEPISVGTEVCPEVEDAESEKNSGTVREVLKSDTCLCGVPGG